ncbi:ester cyclase [Polaromonas sp.]|uniref:ester cyclase n=1 Tax=Polaromonas sp. TaxID=1869339 RepID=UPI0025FCBB53|nr:ester cyclase [Polaromonas sp.]
MTFPHLSLVVLSFCLAACPHADAQGTGQVQRPRPFTQEHIQMNKAVVSRFNKEVIEQGRLDSFQELMDPAFVNHSAPPGMDNGPAGMINTFNNVLRPAFPDLKVVIHEQVAEGDLVTSRKTISGTHLGVLMGIAPTNRKVSIDVIDIVRVKNGRYFEHWGLNTLGPVLQELRKP